MCSDHDIAHLREHLYGIGARDGAYHAPSAYPGLFLPCTGSAPDSHDGDTCPVHEGVSSGAVYAACIRGANYIRSEAARSPFAVYVDAMHGAGSYVGATHEELLHGCPALGYTQSLQTGVQFNTSKPDERG